MTSLEALQSAIDNTTSALFNNGTNDMTLQITYPIFDVALDTNLLVDLIIIPSIEIASGSTIEVKKDGTSLGVFTLSTNKKILYLSELMGVSRETLYTQVSQTLEFVFSTTQLIKTDLVCALSSDFVSADTILTNGLSSNMYLLHETVIDPGDENSLIAIRDAMNDTKTEVTGNGTNVITIKNTFPLFKTALPHELVLDNLITFKDTVGLGTQIFIKKDGVHIKTVTLTTNTKFVWLSSLLESTREALYTKVTETYELSFIYDQYINNQIVAGNLGNFTYANSVAYQPSVYGLFELGNSKSFNNIPIDYNNCDFLIEYDENNKIKKAQLPINSNQSLTFDYVVDNTLSTPVTYARMNLYDANTNNDINLITNVNGWGQLISVMKDVGRGLYD